MLPMDDKGKNTSINIAAVPWFFFSRDFNERYGGVMPVFYREVAAPPPEQGTNKEKLEDLQSIFHKRLWQELASRPYSDHIYKPVIPEGNKIFR